jgi:hypothetical protein
MAQDADLSALEQLASRVYLLEVAASLPSLSLAAKQTRRKLPGTASSDSSATAPAANVQPHGWPRHLLRGPPETVFPMIHGCGLRNGGAPKELFAVKGEDSQHSILKAKLISWAGRCSNADGGWVPGAEGAGRVQVLTEDESTPACYWLRRAAPAIAGAAEPALDPPALCHLARQLRFLRCAVEL